MKKITEKRIKRRQSSQNKKILEKMPLFENSGILKSRTEIIFELEAFEKQNDIIDERWKEFDCFINNLAEDLKLFCLQAYPGETQEYLFRNASYPEGNRMLYMCDHLKNMLKSKKLFLPQFCSLNRKDCPERIKDFHASTYCLCGHVPTTQIKLQAQKTQYVFF